MSASKCVRGIVAIGQILASAAVAGNRIEESLPPVCRQVLELRSQGLPQESWKSEWEDCSAQTTLPQRRWMVTRMRIYDQAAARRQQDSLRREQAQARQAPPPRANPAPRAAQVQASPSPIPPGTTVTLEPVQEPSSAPEQDPRWAEHLPSADEVKSKIGPDLARQDATFGILRDYIDASVSHCIGIATLPDDPPQAVARWQEYRSAESTRHPGCGEHYVTTPEARLFYFDSSFRIEMMNRLLPPGAVAFYRTTRKYHEQTSGQREAAKYNAQRKAEEERDQAKPSARWMAMLPTVEEVRSVIKGGSPKDSALRFEVAIHALQQFYFTYATPNLRNSRYGEYERALNGRIPPPYDAAFIYGVIERFVSTEAAVDFQNRRTYAALVADHSSNGSGSSPSAAEPGPPPAWVQADVKAAKGRTDLKVFGFEFGKKIDLPECTEEGQAAKEGAARACLGDPYGEWRKSWSPEGVAMGLISGLAGLLNDQGTAPPPTPPKKKRPDARFVTLASSSCPTWLRGRASSCAMQIAVAGGTLVSAIVRPEAYEDDLPGDLKEKYGPPDKQYKRQCISQESGTGMDYNGNPISVPLPPVTHDAIGFEWTKLPGLHVRYEPFEASTNCRSGFIQVQLANWYKMNVEAASRAKASGPKM